MRSKQHEKRHNSKLCISVAASTISELSSKVRTARDYSPGFIEMRIDYLEEDLEDFETRIEISKLFDGREILTLRSKTQDGKFGGKEEQRLRLIKSFIQEFRPRIVDVELESLARSEDLLKLLNNKTATSIIASTHYFDRTPARSVLERILGNVPDSVFALKIACFARKFNDNFSVMSLYKMRRTPRLIAFCMGPLGILSRVACVSLGSPLTYASLPKEPVAPGQLDAATMSQLLEV